MRILFLAGLILFNVASFGSTSTSLQKIDKIPHAYWATSEKMKEACESHQGVFIIAWLPGGPIRACTFDDGTVIPEKE